MFEKDLKKASEVEFTEEGWTHFYETHKKVSKHIEDGKLLSIPEAFLWVKVKSIFKFFK